MSLSVARAHASAFGGVFLTIEEYKNLQDALQNLRDELKQATRDLEAIGIVQGEIHDSPPFRRIRRKWQDRAMRHSHP